jgi:signal transduction histidine kinase
VCSTAQRQRAADDARAAERARIAREMHDAISQHLFALRMIAAQHGPVELVVRDEGTGFDPAAGHAGAGLAHIRARVAELGGTADIDSAPGRGTSVTVRVPVP